MGTMTQIPGLRLVHDSLAVVSQTEFISDTAAEDEREWLEIRVKHARFLFELLTEIDLRWRERVFDDASRYNSSDEAILDHVSREMNSALHGLLAMTEARERQGVTIAGTDELRRITRDMAASLTSDGEFFEGESLDVLEATAITEHERGESEVMEDLDREES